MPECEKGTVHENQCNMLNACNNLPMFLLPDNCPCPSSPVNGYIASCVKSALVGSYIHYYCDSGYERVGDFSRMCQVGAIWTGTTPTCVKSESVLISR